MLFCDFNIIENYIFPENFTGIPKVVQKIRRFSLSILTILHLFFGFFDISLLQKI